MDIRVYTTKICPNCKIVKGFLADVGAEYMEVDITTAEALTELRMNGVFTLIAPVVQIGSEFIMIYSTAIRCKKKKLPN